MEKKLKICALDNDCASGKKPLGFCTVPLVASTAALFTLGLVMIYSATSAEVLDQELSKSTFYAVIRQLGYAFFAVACSVALVKFNYLRFINAAPALFILTLFLLLITLIPGIGKEANGSRRWLSLCGISFQPSELAKYVSPAFFIHLIKENKELLTFWRFVKMGAISALPLPLIALEPNNGSAAVVGAALIVVCFIAHLPIRFWAVPLIVCTIVGTIFALNHPYVSARFHAYLNPTKDLKGKGHQPYQAKIAAGAGKLWGKGPGNSWQKLSYLPEAQNDYIAAIFAEEFGFAGVFTIITLYCLLVFSAFAIAITAASLEGYYLGTVIAFLLGIQVILNLAVVSGLIPSTGLNLPFFSQGGSSFVANMMAVALLISIATKSQQLGVDKS